MGTMTWPRLAGLVLVTFAAPLVVFVACAQTHKASATADAPRNSTLGIGFLWTLESQPRLAMLSSESDFVDTLLGDGKLAIFDKVRPPVRVMCIALSLETNEGRPFRGLKETIEALRQARIAPDRVVLAYNPERQPGTTVKELDQLVESVRRAREMAKAYGAPLLVGPGLRDMQQREELYPQLARLCDMWLIQSQRLQLDAATRKPVDVREYRTGVKRIVDRLREGNSKIKIVVQIVTTAERGQVTLKAEQIAAYARSIEDLVDAVRIYGAKGELLGEIIDRIRPIRPGASKPASRPSP